MSNDTRTPQRKAADDAIRRDVEASGTTLSRMASAERAQAIARARQKKQARSKAREEVSRLGRALGALRSQHGLTQAQIAQSLGTTRWGMLHHVIFRAALPEILSGIRISLAISFVLLISAEMVGARKGMGFLIAFLGDSGEYPGMFAVAFTVIFFGFAADRFYLWLMRSLLRYTEG